MCSIRCGWSFGMFSPAGALVLDQLLTAQVTSIRRAICTCHLEMLLSSDIKYYPFPLIQSTERESWWDCHVFPKSPSSSRLWLCLLSAEVTAPFPAIKLRKKWLATGQVMGQKPAPVIGMAQPFSPRRDL